MAVVASVQTRRHENRPDLAGRGRINCLCTAAVNRKKKNREGRYEETKEMVLHRPLHEPSSAYFEANAEQGRRMEAIAGCPEVQVSKAPGRDRMIDERAEDELEQAYRIR